MTSAPVLRRFALATFAWFACCMLVWSQISAWTSYPAAAVAQVLLDSQVHAWVESTNNEPGKLSAKVRFRKLLTDQRVATPIVVVEPAHYAYGLNLFLALLLASRARKLWLKMILGYSILCLPQALSLVLVLMGQIVREVPIDLLSISVLQLDAIIVGNMFCMVVLPTLAPVVLWLWFQWDYFEAIAPGLKASFAKA